MRIALLEDDKDQSDLLCAWLEGEQYSCTVFEQGNMLIRACAQESYDLILLDWMVPEMSGLEVLKHIRRHGDTKVPVIFITQRDAEADIVEALENGADDYMSKPVTEKETLARIKALARRSGFGGEAEGEILDFEPYQIDTHARKISMDGEEVSMTQKEYELTLFLFRNVGKIVSRGHLLEVVWGTNPDINTRTVDTHISRLRSKLNLNEDDGWKLTSVYQHGYRLEK